MSERNPAYLDSWVENARQLRQGYQPEYSLGALREPAHSARRMLVAQVWRRRLAAATTTGVLLASIWAIGLFSVGQAPASSGVWNRASGGFAGGFTTIGNWFGAALEVGQEEYEKHVTEVFLNELVKMTLPDDIADSIGSFVDEITEPLDLGRASGMVGGLSQQKDMTEHYRDMVQFGWKPIRSQLESIEGLPLDSAVEPYEQLTSRERALLSPIYTRQRFVGDDSSPGSGMLPYTLALLCTHDPRVDERLDGLDARAYARRLIGSEGYLGMVEARRAFSPAEAERWLAKNFLARVASPVTGRIFEPDHPEFSRGNGYIKRITNPSSVQQLEKAVVDAGVVELDNTYAHAPPGHDWPALKQIEWFYFRIYGEDSVIAEGIIPMDSVSFPARALHAEDFSERTLRRFRERLAEARKPAPDYEEWLHARTTAEIGDYAAGLLRNTRLDDALRIPLDTSGASNDELNALRRGNLRGLKTDSISGLPLDDPLPAPSDLEQDERVLIATALSGDNSALNWFRATGATAITSMAEWMQYSFSRDQLLGLLRASSSPAKETLNDYLRKLLPPYAAGTPYSYFLPIYRDFEPYQGYFERIVEPEALAKVEKAAGRSVKDVIYFRLYGAERVIAEGVWAE